MGIGRSIFSCYATARRVSLEEAISKVINAYLIQESRTTLMLVDT